MAAKTLLPNQCTPLHFLYGRDNCCLCNAQLKITELEARIKELEDKLQKRNKSTTVNFRGEDVYQ